MASHTRITAQFKPDQYNLDLSLDTSSKEFFGDLQITGQRRSRPSYRITLHQADLKISSAQIFRLEKGQKTEVPIIRIIHHKKRQEVRLHSSEQIYSSNYLVKLKYSGKVASHGISGIYLSYTDISELDSPKSSTQQEIITTQFQPHYARTLLPCIDEPEAKAVFNFNLNLRSNQGEDTEALKSSEVLFNTSPNSDIFNISTEHRELRFQPTPKMSSYLLALTIGNLGYRELQSKNGVTIRALATPNKVKDTAFALDFASKTLKLLEDLFKFEYPLQKLDLVAVPDFDAGGMENWGLIHFREELLLFDEGLATLADKQAIAQTIAHELSHQWFGNLVTMKWWDEIWLNEGFANFMELYIVDKFFPDWKVFEENLVTSRSGAIRLDSLPSSKSIVKKVRCAHQVEQAFDTVAYQKSSSVIQMVFNLLGQDNFFKGLSNYFKKFKFSNATSSDLISCWQPFIKLNLTEFLDSWLYKPGLPLLRASVDNDGNRIVLTQSKFSSELSLVKSFEDKVQFQIQEALSQKPHLGKKQKVFYANNIRNRLNKENNKPVLWQIPIDFIQSQNDNPSTLLKSFVMKNETHKILYSTSHTLPIKLNKGASNLYITSYSLEFLAQISQAISNNKLESTEVLNLLTDAISLNRAGQFEPGTAAILNIIENAAKGNTNPNFWALVGGFIAYLHYHIKYCSEPIERALRPLEEYIERLIQQIYQEVGSEEGPSDSFQMINLRFEILSLAALGKNRSLLLGLSSEFRDNILSFGNINPEKRMLVLYAVAKEGRAEDYRSLLSLYEQNLEDVSLRDDIAYGLCSFEGLNITKSNLEIIQDPTLVRSQDIVNWISILANSSKLGSEVISEWTVKKGGWCWLEKNLSTSDLSILISILFETVFTVEDLAYLKKFITEIGSLELQKSLDESVEIAKSRMCWHNRELTAVIKYLNDSAVRNPKLT